MNIRILFIGIVSILTLLFPQPAHANMLRDARKTWKEKVVTPIASPLMRIIKPPLKWKELSSEKKTEKLTKAKQKIEETAQLAFRVLDKFERRPRFQHTAIIVRLDLEDDMEQVRNAKSPEQFEDAVKQLQEDWNMGKEELRSEL